MQAIYRVMCIAMIALATMALSPPSSVQAEQSGLRNTVIQGLTAKTQHQRVNPGERHCAWNSENPCRDGDFAQYCEDCSEDGFHKIRCTCTYLKETIDAFYFWGPCTNLQLNRDGDNAKLWCESCPKRNCPAGHYLDICVDCEYDEESDVLTCTCPRGTREFKNTKSCPSISVSTEINGDLICRDES